MAISYMFMSLLSILYAKEYIGCTYDGNGESSVKNIL
jgi:hypothetical protein